MLQKLIRGSLISTFIWVVFSCASAKITKYDCVDNKACAEYERQLELIENYNFFQIYVEYEKLALARTFFEDLTGYKSDADVQIDGQLPPTIKDYYNWTAWYSINYNKLRYDEENDIVHTAK